MATRLVIGCCNSLYNEGVRKLLEDDKDIKVIGLFDEGSDLKDVIKLNPDIILTDIHVFQSFPADMVTSHELKFLLISDIKGNFLYSSSDMLNKLISRGVVGILPPGSDSCLLKKALKAVHNGELWLSRNSMKNILSDKSSLENKTNFSKREEQILALICRGYRNKEIAQKLDIEEQTVKSHCNRIYKKVGVSDRLQLALHIYRTWPDLIR